MMIIAIVLITIIIIIIIIINNYNYNNAYNKNNYEGMDSHFPAIE